MPSLPMTQQARRTDRTSFLATAEAGRLRGCTTPRAWRRFLTNHAVGDNGLVREDYNATGDA